MISGPLGNYFFHVLSVRNAHYYKKQKAAFFALRGSADCRALIVFVLTREGYDVKRQKLH
jgi:hypothetical protein